MRLRHRTLAASALLIITLLAACKPGDSTRPAEPLTVLAAVSLSTVFRDIGATFQRVHKDTTVQFSFAASNQLRTQLEHGAPGDLFASADRRQMDAAVAGGVVDPATVRVIAHNSVALIVPKANALGITGLADLARPGVKIVVADPAVPVGNATRQMLDRASAVPALGAAFVAAFDKATVSREENAAAVVAKIALGEADAAIAYSSDAAGAHASGILMIPLPSSVTVRTDIVIAVTARAAQPEFARQFVEHLATPTARERWRSAGFLIPESAAK